MLNSITLIGRLAADPSAENTGGEDANGSVARYRLAVERDYRDADGERPVDFFLCKAQGEPARFAADRFRKGDTVAVNGKLYTYRYKKGGEDAEHFYVTVHVRSHYLVKTARDVPDSGTVPYGS